MTTEEKTIELEIPWLLPGIENENDGCLERLAEALQNAQGICKVHLERGKKPIDLCLHYDPQQVTAQDVKTMAQRAGNNLLNRYRHKTLVVNGMDCSDCALVVEHRLGRLSGVQAVDVDFASGNVQIEYDARRINQRAIERRVRELGYDLSTRGWSSFYRANRELIFSLLAGLALLTGWIGVHYLGLSSQAGLALYLTAYALGGYDPARHALHNLSQRHFDTDILMLAAALGAALLGDFAEGALLLFLFSLGHALEERAMDRARDAINALASLAPKVALVSRAGSLSEIPVAQVTLGEMVIIRPGVRAPVDGEVLAGHSAMDDSPVTGESLPVEKMPGSRVFAGAVNGSGVLEVRADRLAKDSTLARVMELVEQAQEQKSPTKQMTEKFTRIFVPVVLGLDALLILVLPLLGVPFSVAFSRAMTLLVAASPCALALGTPATLMAGIAQAARNGVLVKGGAHLENLGRLRSLAFDKTGTLTLGQPQVTDVVAVGQVAEDEVLAWAAAVERHSAHPLAQAIISSARSRNLEIEDVVAVEATTGRGIQAEVGGRTLWLGNQKFCEERGLKFSQELDGKVAAWESQGKSVIFVGRDSQLAGLIALADVIRNETAQALSDLRRLGVHHIVMLSGDTPAPASHIAAQAGVSEVYAGLMPDDKLKVIQALVERYQVVGMVGDGVNDAPALAQATVGIAMGGAATDVALEAADVALMASDLSRLPFAIGLGRATRRTIRQNLIIAMAVTLILVGAALAGSAGIGIVVLIHEGSTLLVVANALRLLRFYE